MKLNLAIFFLGVLTAAAWLAREADRMFSNYEHFSAHAHRPRGDCA